MTATGPSIAPFRSLARWLQQALPPRWRGLARVGPEADVARLPPRARVRLDLPESALLWREVDAPAEALSEDRRRAWIEARLEGVSPWASGAFYWAEGRETRGRLPIALAAAAPATALAARLQDSGGRLVEVCAGACRLYGDRAAEDRLTRRLAGAWLLAMALGTGLSLWSGLRVEAANTAADLARQRLARIAASTLAMNDLSRAALALVAQKTPAASLAQGLDRLAAGLPSDSYVETLRLTSQTFEITGQSAAPDAIIPALQATGAFTGVDFAGASAHDADTGLYTFSIQGRMRGTP